MLNPSMTYKEPPSIPAAGWPRLLVGCAVPAAFVIVGRLGEFDGAGGWWLLLLASVIVGGAIAASWLYVLMGPLAAVAVLALLFSAQRDDLRQVWNEFTDTCDEEVADPEACEQLRDINFDDVVLVAGAVVAGTLYVVMAVISVIGVAVGKAVFPHRPSPRQRWGAPDQPEDQLPPALPHAESPPPPV